MVILKCKESCCDTTVKFDLNNFKSKEDMDNKIKECIAKYKQDFHITRMILIDENGEEILLKGDE